ncbi:MAG: thiol peroxidase [Bacteroidales bacterium]|nr:thiol peroxidase [Bacteroidales bacterium]MCF8334166.1 thiol peroxidase [Bacteroidales bacterium]
MAELTLKGNKIHTNGDIPKVGDKAPDFKLTKTDLSDVSLDSFKGQKVVLNIFPSLDTEVCANSVRKFNAEASDLDNTLVVSVSRDLPFAHHRFCSNEGLDNVVSTSELRPDSTFARDYGLQIIDGPMAGLMARTVIILDEQGKVIYTEQVPEIAQEPDYKAAMAALK